MDKAYLQICQMRRYCDLYDYPERRKHIPLPNGMAASTGVNMNQYSIVAIERFCADPLQKGYMYE